MEKSGYEDIINLSHPVSTKHKHMSMEDRAAQFSPFAALTGLDESMEQTGKRHEAQMNLPNETFLEDA